MYHPVVAGVVAVDDDDDQRQEIEERTQLSTEDVKLIQLHAQRLKAKELASNLVTTMNSGRMQCHWSERRSALTTVVAFSPNLSIAQRSACTLHPEDVWTYYMPKQVLLDECHKALPGGWAFEVDFVPSQMNICMTLWTLDEGLQRSSTDYTKGEPVTPGDDDDQ